MGTKVSNGRESAADVHPWFLERWSPRAFSAEPVTDAEVTAIFEAARWAPSCYGEEPWMFLYARSPAELDLFRPLLVDANRAWADRAPVLAFAFARLQFKRNEKPNRWAQFDAGAAWMSLALQAHALGLFAHAMGGIHEEKVYDALGVPRDRYEAMCAIAIGRPGDPAALPESLRERERASGRVPLAEIVHEGRFPKPER
ncbi:MAG: nitroreductase family protein [Myxococcales bacterium]|nr:nitroreductase family protein [Myxococcales bacterium]